MNAVQPTRALIGFALLLFGVGAAHASEPLEAAVDSVVDHVKPALVRIHVVSTSYRSGRELKYQSSGSGAIISTDGYVVTNHHVAGHAKRLLCTLSDRSEVEADLIGSDALTDIAVIKLHPRKNGGTYPHVSFGDSDRVRVGDHVLAMGSPLSISQSVTLGIISNTEMVMPRRMGGGGFRLDGEDVGTIVKWFAHDAVIYPGNSGGPLVNLDGLIIGINEISFGLGGAIPGNLVRDVSQALIDHGSVVRSWIGMTIQPLLKSSDMERGILVTGAIDDSPADTAGFLAGDILVTLDGRETTIRYDEEIPEFNRFVAGIPVGASVTAEVLRDGSPIELTLTTTERKRRRPQQREFKEWGITGRNLSEMMAKELKRDTTDGIYVTSVAPGGPSGAAKPGILRGDILVAVGNQSVENLDELVRHTTDLLDGSEDPVPVLATFERKAATFMTAVEVGIRELNDPGLEVKKAWLPVNTQVITREIAKLLGDESLTGFRVTQVYPESSAETAGVEVGDLILSVDGEKLRASAPEHYEELTTLIRNYRTGSEVALGIRRGEETLSVTVKLVRAPKLDREMRKYQDENFEFTARNITFFDKADEQWKQESSGVIVTEVKSGSWAELGMMRAGDLLQQVNDAPISSVDDLRERMEAVESDHASAVVMKVLRGIYTVFVEMEPKWDQN